MRVVIDVCRLGRKQADQFLTRLEDCGLSSKIASTVVEEQSRKTARAMVVLASHGRFYQETARDWYQKLGFESEIPDPEISLSEQVEQTLNHRVLLWRAPETVVSHARLMSTLKCAGIVQHGNYRADVEWEPNAQGYWFWLTVGVDGFRRPSGRPHPAERSPISTVHLPSIEEIVLATTWLPDVSDLHLVTRTHVNSAAWHQTLLVLRRTSEYDRQRGAAIWEINCSLASELVTINRPVYFADMERVEGL